MPKHKPTTPTRNRNAEAKSKGKRQATFEISTDLDALIERVRVVLAERLGGCTRVQALEAMGREGARWILAEERIAQK